MLLERQVPTKLPSTQPLQPTKVFQALSSASRGSLFLLQLFFLIFFIIIPEIRENSIKTTTRSQSGHAQLLAWHPFHGSWAVPGLSHAPQRVLPYYAGLQIQCCQYFRALFAEEGRRTQHFSAVRGSGAPQHSVSLHAVVCTLLTSHLCFQTSHVQVVQQPRSMQLCWQSMRNLPSPALRPLPEENNTVCCCQHAAFPKHSHFVLLKMLCAASCVI